ncbi:MAG: penicillin-binding transpeptidase domain-containing protein, partial [Spirochaetaceae bacterium]|nr:penicillin-binding transpeptidase domain-containing protein [Spirochaetaceae bacterium]
SSGSIELILCYLCNITMEEWQMLYNQGYENDNIIGKNGIEKVYDSLLKGTNGFYLNTVDVKGRNVSDTQIIPPENGYNLVLTVDKDIQLLAEKALGPRMGSVIVLKPYTGEILAMVSYPSYNPDLFYEEGPQSFKSLSLNRDFPFLNRAIQSSYAPASSFKILMTFALLAEGWDPNREILCQGSMTLGDRDFSCWKKTGHGSLNLQEALAQSCNIYFGTAGVESLGIEGIKKYSDMFGLDQLSGIDIPGETSGNIPDPQWKEDIYHTPWTGGDTLNASIGQGFVSVTPLEMANLVAMIVNGGVLYKPYFLDKVINPATGEVVMQQEKEIIRDIRGMVDPEIFTQIQEDMRGVITTGTARVAILNNVVDIAGKTGTGEVGLDDNFHAWFVSYGPYETENPEDRVVVVTQVEAYNDNWDWWAIKAADMIYQGIFADQTYEEVVTSMKKRWVWYVRDIELEEESP